MKYYFPNNSKCLIQNEVMLYPRYAILNSKSGLAFWRKMNCIHYPLKENCLIHLHQPYTKQRCPLNMFCCCNVRWHKFPTQINVVIYTILFCKVEFSTFPFGVIRYNIQQMWCDVHNKMEMMARLYFSCTIEKHDKRNYTIENMSFADFPYLAELWQMHSCTENYCLTIKCFIILCTVYRILGTSKIILIFEFLKLVGNHRATITFLLRMWIILLKYPIQF